MAENENGQEQGQFVPPDGFVTVEGAAEAANYSVHRIRHLLSQNRIVGSIKQGGRRLIPLPVKFMNSKGEEQLLTRPIKDTVDTESKADPVTA